jgi:hypothetical protein
MHPTLAVTEIEAERTVIGCIQAQRLERLDKKYPLIVY